MDKWRAVWDLFNDKLHSFFGAVISNVPPADFEQHSVHYSKYLAFIHDMGRVVMNTTFIKWLVKVVMLIVVAKIAGAILNKYISPKIMLQLGRIFISTIVLLWYLKIIRIPSISRLLVTKHGHSTIL